MLRPVTVTALPDYKIHLTYSDGVTGEVDLSHLVGKGVFSAWSDQETFREVSLGDHGQIRWSDEIELCPDAIIGGEVSPRATGLVMEWAAQHREDLLQAWDQARRMETLDRIDPLR